MKTLFLKTVLGIGFFLTACLAPGEELQESAWIARGRYVVKTTGCNDCHTPRYGELEGKVPENQWLMGVGIGYKGGWGTTYPANLRRLIATTSEARWVRYAKRMKAKPPMPWYNVNAMTENDLKAVYRFIRSLGDSRNRVPEELPPGVTPRTPYINFDVIVPHSHEY
jgi:mono/diheme cytochrome c family protein